MNFGIRRGIRTISWSSGEIEKSVNPVLLSRSSPRHDHNDRQIPVNSRQAAINCQERRYLASSTRTGFARACWMRQFQVTLQPFDIASINFCRCRDLISATALASPDSTKVAAVRNLVSASLEGKRCYVSFNPRVPSSRLSGVWRSASYQYAIAVTSLSSSPRQTPAQ